VCDIIEAKISEKSQFRVHNKIKRKLDDQSDQEICQMITKDVSALSTFLDQNFDICAFPLNIKTRKKPDKELSK
jgi:hypothetical protein